MLLEKLVEYADTELAKDALPAGYQVQPVRYIVSLDRAGTYLPPVIDTVSKEAKRGSQRPAPHVKRTMGIAPKLLADTGEYVLGIAREDPKKPPKLDRIAEQHRQFTELVMTCAEDTREPSVLAVAAFLANGAPIPEDDRVALDASQTVTFRVDGDFPIDLPTVRQWWAKQRAPEQSEVAEAIDECIICGKRGPVLERHPLKIKGIPGGQIQKDLISANAGAFESYGMKASRIAPTCPECAEKYGNALNALLANEDTRIWTKELAYAFWVRPATTSPTPTPGATLFQPVPMVTRPQEHPAEVRELLTSPFKGTTTALSVNPDRFYGVALGASGARVVVKDWIDTTVDEAKVHLGRYFQLQELVRMNEDDQEFYPFFTLAGATVRRGDTPVSQVGKSLIRLAFAGNPLPMDLLHIAVRRNRAEQAVSRPRAVLIKMVLGSRGIVSMEEPGVMVGLNPDDDSAAYQCGRLLQTLAEIQYAALGRTNTTVVSRYYGTASASPQTVFPGLLRTANAHLRRMERDSFPAFVRLNRQLDEILWHLDGKFPKMLSAEDQGRFSLGFYHQRAQRQLDIAANKAKRAANNPAAADDPTDE